MKKDFYMNELMSVRFFEKTEYAKPYIIVRDLTDRHNEPTAFTRKVRGIEKCWEYLEEVLNDEDLKDRLKLYDITKILDDKFNLSTHHYCAMD